MLQINENKIQTTKPKVINQFCTKEQWSKKHWHNADKKNHGEHCEIRFLLTSKWENNRENVTNKNERQF